MEQASPREGPPPARPLKEGRITRLAAQRHDPNRVSVFLDETFAFGVHVDVMMTFELHKGCALSIDVQRQIIEADRVQQAGAKAMEYLARRARTVREVRQKLAQRGFGEAVAEQVVSRLVERGHLDDEAYARAYARARFETRGHGPQRIRSDLLRRGVPAAFIDVALEELVAREDLMEAARRHAEKRWQRLAGEPDPRKRRKKLYDYLLRRGYGYDTIQKVAEELEHD